MKKTLATGAVAVCLAIGGAYWIESIWPFPSAKKALEGVKENRGRIDHLEVRVEGVEGDVGTLSSEVGELETAVDSQQETLDAQESKIGSLRDTIDGLRSDLTALRKAQRDAETRAQGADRERKAILDNLEAMSEREERMQRLLDGFIDRLESLEKAFVESKNP